MQGSKTLANRSEHRFVLEAISFALARSVERDIRAVGTQDLDWDYLFRFARRHAVLPLIYVYLARVAEQIPPDVLGPFRKYYRENAARNVLLTEELTRILNSLALSGIEAIPYKGPALALSAYGNLAWRRFVDLDIMVRKQDLQSAKAILNAHGYDCTNAWTKAQELLLLRTQHNLPFTREEGRLIVELHWEVASELFAPALQAERLWQRLESMDLKGLEVKTLGREDLLLSLCVHGSRHVWEKLSWICDLAAVIRHGVDWKVVLDRAGTEENTRMLLLGVLLADNLFEVPLPLDLQNRLDAEPGLQGLAETVAKRLFGGPEHTPVGVGTSLSFNVRLRRDWASRLRYVRLMMMPTDGDVARISLPRGLSFGYYLMRPFRLLVSGRGN
jgi:hypothetical protein